jgi:queuine tRNA-ribosyltransferase
MMFKLLNTHEKARRGTLETRRGIIQTPFFMNVATSAAIKGGISAPELAELKCQVMLCNTYHLHIRPGDDVIADMGGLHRFTNWKNPILTDSGGFQVFSLGRTGAVAKPPRIKEEGVYFSSHTDGKKIFMGPEESMRIQHNLGADIVMAFDECIPSGSTRDYVERSVERTTRWLVRCQEELTRLNSPQMLFGINQGGVYEDIRIAHMKELVGLMNGKGGEAESLGGYAIGGLAVGEAKEDMFRVIEATEPHMPTSKPRYLMGVGTPSDIIEAVYRGIDMFDCVMPTRNARHGTIFTSEGIMHVGNARYTRDERPLDERCGCPTCRDFSRAYIRHLFKSQEYLAGRLASVHNLYFYNDLTEKIRMAIEEERYTQFREEWSERLARLIE